MQDYQCLSAVATTYVTLVNIRTHTDTTQWPASMMNSASWA